MCNQIDEIIENLNLGNYINLYHYYWYYKARTLPNEIDLCDRLIVLSKESVNYNVDFIYNDDDVKYFYEFLLSLFNKDILYSNDTHYLNKTYYSLSFTEEKLREWLNRINIIEFNIEYYFPNFLDLNYNGMV